MASAVTRLSPVSMTTWAIAGGVQRLHGFARLRSDGVGDRDEPADVPRVADGDDGLAVGFQRFCLSCSLERVLAALDDIPMGAEPERFAVEHARSPFPLRTARPPPEPAYYPVARRSAEWRAQADAWSAPRALRPAPTGRPPCGRPTV